MNCWYSYMRMATKTCPGDWTESTGLLRPILDYAGDATVNMFDAPTS